MLLKELLLEVGDFCFENKSLQYLPYILVILVELERFKDVNESVPYEVFCFLVVIFGVFVRFITIGFRPQKIKSDTLITSGIYSVVRNPLYLGNFFIFFGITLLSQSCEIIVTNSLLMIIFYFLIVLKEEDVLVKKFGRKYVDWANSVSCFVPSFKNYVKPDMRFSFKNAISHEHDVWFLVVVSFVGLEIIRGYFEVNKFFLISVWAILLSVATLFWIVCKILKFKKIL